MNKNNIAIPLFWWSEIKFTFKKKENYGDLLSKYLAEKISGRTVKWVHPKKQPWYTINKKNYLTIGSILHHASKDSVVWGSGIIDCKHPVVAKQFRAVRGPETRKYLLGLGHTCPEVYGDPALLLPKYYPGSKEKKFKLGIIAHYHDFQQVFEMYKDNSQILVIDLMTLDVEAVTNNILLCEQTISSSLHGLVVSHAYDIPSVWVEFSNKIFGDGIKYKDYLESVEIPFYQGIFLDSKKELPELQRLVQKHPSLPAREKILGLQQGLLASCPFL